jgi:hypothetical protein
VAAETDNQKVKFDLDGTLYEFPDILDLDMDEWIVVYEYCGLTLGDFAPISPEVAAIRASIAQLEEAAGKLSADSDERVEADGKIEDARARLGVAEENLTDEQLAVMAEREHKLRHPGFMKAMFYIAYKRAHPKKTRAAIEKLLSSVTLLAMFESMDSEEDGVDGDPPTSTNEPVRLSERRPNDSTLRPSPLSLASSETPEDLPAPTGLSR